MTKEEEFNVVMKIYQSIRDRNNNLRLYHFDMIQRMYHGWTYKECMITLLKDIINHDHPRAI